MVSMKLRQKFLSTRSLHEGMIWNRFRHFQKGVICISWWNSGHLMIGNHSFVFCSHIVQDVPNILMSSVTFCLFVVSVITPHLLKQSYTLYKHLACYDLFWQDVDTDTTQYATLKTTIISWHVYILIYTTCFKCLNFNHNRPQVRLLRWWPNILWLKCKMPSWVCNFIHLTCNFVKIYCKTNKYFIAPIWPKI